MTMSRTARRCLLTVLLAMSARAAFPQDGEPELRVYVMDTVGLTDDLLDLARVEVDAIYTASGVRIVWLDERPHPAEMNEARVYILDELPPSLRSLMRITKGSAPMAITLGRRSTEPSANIYVSREAVLSRAGHRRALAKIHMARALGRTLAHELAHRFLRSGHTDEGILKSVITEHDLTDGNRSDLFFTAEQNERLWKTASKAKGRRDSVAKKPPGGESPSRE